jgi:sugar phosphate isomerase/epimerase
MDRRSFISHATGAALLAGGAFGPMGWPAAAQGGKPSGKVNVSGHLWVYAAEQPGYDPTPVLEQVFADFAYAGLDRVELMHQALRHADAVDRIGNLKEKHRVGVLGTSYEANMWDKGQHGKILDDAGPVITRLSQLGGRTFGVSVGAAPAPKTPGQLDAQAELLRQLTRLCEAGKVTLNLHNHTYEVEKGGHDLKGTLERLPGAKLGPDLNWLVRAGVDPVTFIRQHGSRIVFLHLRDQHRSGRWSEALGEGDTDFAAIGRALREVNFSGDAVIELAHEGDFTPTRPLRESWKMSREYVRKTLGY